MPIDQLTEDVWQLSGFPANNINVYIAGDVLIDSGLAVHRRRLMSQLRGRTITTHALTHAHFDHYGSSHAVCSELQIPMWCGREDAADVRAGRMLGPGGRRLRAAHPQAIERELAEGDVVAGFEVLDTPGHSPGHISFWRERDRVLICGDVLWGQNPFTASGGPREPFPFVNPDTAANRRSARRLAELRPELVCFGHGRPLRDPGRFAEIVSRLPLD